MRGTWAATSLLGAALAIAGAAAQERPPAQEPPPAAQESPPSAQGSPPTAPGAPRAESPPAPQETPRAAEQPSPSEDAPPTDDAAPQQQAAADAGPASESDEDVPYTVECGPDPEEGRNVCQVDRSTYVGWRTFHSVCHTCHAQDAVGSTFAPDLLPRIRQMTKEHFLQVVDQGFTGQVGVMPAWGTNPNVNKYYDELWSYLRARADGVLLPGRPKRLPD